MNISKRQADRAKQDFKETILLEVLSEPGVQLPREGIIKLLSVLRKDQELVENLLGPVLLELEEEGLIEYRESEGSWCRIK